MSRSSGLNAISRTFKNNSPTILSGAAIAGVITTAILTAKATLKASQQLDDASLAKNAGKESKEGWEDLTRREIAETCWKTYAPAGLSGAATIACIVGANQIGLRRNAALLGAYTLADTAFREYKDEVLAQLGETKEQKVRDGIAKKQLEENPVTNTTVIVGGGDQLCYDSLTGRYFRGDIETIRQAANEINRSIVGGNMYASQNEFYGFLGLGPVTLGDELGWNLDNFIDLVFSSHLADDGRPCLAIGYKSLPRKDYGKF
jgi:hypothetical protein